MFFMITFTILSPPSITSYVFEAVTVATYLHMFNGEALLG